MFPVIKGLQVNCYNCTWLNIDNPNFNNNVNKLIVLQRLFKKILLSKKLKKLKINIR